MRSLLLASLCLLATAIAASAETTSPLFARGYTVLPTPQRVELGSEDFAFSSDWRLELGPGAGVTDAAEELQRLLQERFRFAFQGRIAPGSGNSRNPAVHLAVMPNTVAIQQAADRDKTALAEQAYRLLIAPNGIQVIGNSATGLFYGVQTLAQLLKQQSGTLWLPEVQIDDWPDLELRVIYWDDAHHLEHLNDLKAAIRQASFYKINGFAIKLEGHFQYAHAPAVVDPYALSASEMQELTDYGLKYHVQVIPYLDGPAHDAFILKHPEYASLREYPESNYEFCVTNPKTYDLFKGMFDDLLAANQGGKYFVLSTDEPYYVGLADNAQCHEAQRAKELGSVGNLLADFVTKTADYLHQRGRTVIFWGEYPLKPADIKDLPPYMVNGEVYGPLFDPVFRAHGIRQMVYTSTEGEEQLFPRYYAMPSTLHARDVGEDSGKGRVQEMLDSIALSSTSDLSSTRPGSARADGPDLLGVFVAGWADAGLNPETFWLGYATGPAAGWNKQAINSQELQNCFYSLFYGRQATNIGRLYQLMSEGAQFWEDSWDVGPSAARKPIWGDSYTQFQPPKPARDQFLPELPVPSGDLLHLGFDWHAENDARLKATGEALAQNDELLDLLNAELERVQFNRYNLAVYLSIAGLYRQNLTMIEDLGRISDLLTLAQQAAGKAEASRVLQSLDRALDVAESIRSGRNQVLQNATSTWYQVWFPRVSEANGRTYLHEVDDVKDHQPMRTIDMSYLVYRELLYPLGEWAAKVAAVRNQYASNHNLPVRQFELNWKEISSGEK